MGQALASAVVLQPLQSWQEMLGLPKWQEVHSWPLQLTLLGAVLVLSRSTAGLQQLLSCRAAETSPACLWMRWEWEETQLEPSPPDFPQCFEVNPELQLVGESLVVQESCLGTAERRL